MCEFWWEKGNIWWVEIIIDAFPNPMPQYDEKCGFVQHPLNCQRTISVICLDFECEKVKNMIKW